MSKSKISCSQSVGLIIRNAFVKRSGFSRAISLSEALMLLRYAPCGRLHDGLDDAINTAKLIEMLESDPDYQIRNYEKELAISAEHCSFAWEICLRG